MRSTTPTRGPDGGPVFAGSRNSSHGVTTAWAVVSRFTFRSTLPYDLVFDMRSVRVEKHRLLEGVASGELAGVGRWRFFTQGDTTAVTYEWDVETTTPWLNALTPIARPLFAWNHDRVMRAGGEGLAGLVGGAAARTS